MMPLTFPLPLSEFQDVIRVSKRGFSVNSPMNRSRTAGGVPLPSSIGEPVWRGSFEIPLTNDRSVSGRIDSLLSVLDFSGASFLVYDPAQPYPAADPDGDILGAAIPTVRALDVNDARMVAVGNLPDSYVLTAGDLVGWRSGDQYMLHRLVSDVSADSFGDTPLFEVRPFIQPTTQVGDLVTLVKPVMKAVLESSPDYGSARAVISSGKSFSFVQSLR